MNVMTRGIVLAAAGFALGTMAVGSLWWAWPRSSPESSRELSAPPELRPVAPAPTVPSEVPQREPRESTLVPEPARKADPRPPEAAVPLPPPPPSQSSAPPPAAPETDPSPPPAAKLLGDFFGFPVETLEEAPKAAAPAPTATSTPAPTRPPPPAIAAPPRAIPLRLHLVPLEGRCVAGFDGSSTLHDFRGWTKKVTGEAEFEPARIDDTAKATFLVDARTLDTGDADRDKAMHEEHLESTKYPEMKFTLAEFRTKEKGACSIRGTLEIHGQRRPAEFAGTFDLRPDRILHVKGELRTKMSEFGITPPSKVLIIRTADEIKVWFEVWAAPREVGK